MTGQRSIMPKWHDGGSAPSHQNEATKYYSILSKRHGQKIPLMPKRHDLLMLPLTKMAQSVNAPLYQNDTIR